MEENINIPDGWHQINGENLFKVQGGYAFKSDTYLNEGILLVRIGNVGNGSFSFKDPIFVSKRFVFSHSNFLLNKGDVLMGLTGDLGKVCQLITGDFPYILNQRVGRFICSNKMENSFLFYLLSSSFIQTKFEGFFSGGAQKNISPKQIESIDYLIPKDIREQSKIAEILTKVDKAILQTEQLIFKYNRIKTGLKKDLFSKGIDDNGNIRNNKEVEFKETPWGFIPKNWICKPLGECCYITKLAGYEFTKHINYIDDGEIIALRAMNIKNEQLLLDDVQRISKNVSDYLVRSKLYNGDILITYIGAYIGDVVQIRENDKYHLAPNIAKIVAGNSLTSDFLENILRTEIVRKQINALITTTANPSLTMGQIRKIQVFFPKDFEEQNRINSKILSVNTYLENNKIELNKLKSIKAGLMQDLLSGKKRVTHLIN